MAERERVSPGPCVGLDTAQRKNEHYGLVIDKNYAFSRIYGQKRGSEYWQI